MIAKIPSFLPKLSNFSSKGVTFSSFELSINLFILPFELLSPTAITTAFPLPSIHPVADKIIGDFSSFISNLHLLNISFFICLLSPVKLLSSNFILFPSINNKSAGIISPDVI